MEFSLQTFDRASPPCSAADLPTVTPPSLPKPIYLEFLRPLLCRAMVSLIKVGNCYQRIFLRLGLGLKKIPYCFFWSVCCFLARGEMVFHVPLIINLTFAFPNPACSSPQGPPTQDQPLWKTLFISLFLPHFCSPWLIGHQYN